MVTVAQRREGAQTLQAAGLSERRSCALAGLSRTGLHYQPQAGGDAAVIVRLKTLAVQHPRYGARRMHALLRQERPIPTGERGVAAGRLLDERELAAPVDPGRVVSIQK